jgi:hypothetical protein
MAANDPGRNVRELLAERRVVLQSLLYVRSQIAAVTDHVAGLEKQIRALEQGRSPVSPTPQPMN